MQILLFCRGQYCSVNGKCFTPDKYNPKIGGTKGFEESCFGDVECRFPFRCMKRRLPSITVEGDRGPPGWCDIVGTEGSQCEPGQHIQCRYQYTYTNIFQIKLVIIFKLLIAKSICQVLNHNKKDTNGLICNKFAT